MIQPGQAAYVLLGNGRGKLLQDQGVGVRRVSHDEDLDEEQALNIIIIKNSLLAVTADA